jgi:hypothetical protein
VVSGGKAVVTPTIGQNMTGYGTADNWWDVSVTVPGSAAIESVTVQCGDNVLADLHVPQEKAS